MWQHSCSGIDVNLSPCPVTANVAMAYNTTGTSPTVKTMYGSFENQLRDQVHAIFWCILKDFIYRVLNTPPSPVLLRNDNIRSCNSPARCALPNPVSETEYPVLVQALARSNFPRVSANPSLPTSLTINYPSGLYHNNDLSYFIHACYVHGKQASSFLPPPGTLDNSR